jgi:hypothetical protein
MSCLNQVPLFIYTIGYKEGFQTQSLKSSRPTDCWPVMKSTNGSFKYVCVRSGEFVSL